MSTLVAIAYPEQHTASEGMATLIKLAKEHQIELEDVAYVTKGVDGKIKLNQAVNLTGAGAASGAMWGTLIGLLFLNPVAGLVAGAAGGALSGKMTDIGIDDRFMKETGAALQNDTSALFVLVRSVNEDKVLPAIGKLGGKVLRTSLSDEQEAKLRTALGDQPA